MTEEKESFESRDLSYLFLAYLEKKGKLSLLPQIVEELKKKAQEKEIEGEAISITPLDKSQIRKIEDFLKKKLKQKVRMKNLVDKKIIGGLIIRFKDFVIDQSVAGKLRQIRQQIYGD